MRDIVVVVDKLSFGRMSVFVLMVDKLTFCRMSVFAVMVGKLTFCHMSVIVIMVDKLTFCHMPDIVVVVDHWQILSYPLLYLGMTVSDDGFHRDVMCFEVCHCSDEALFLHVGAARHFIALHKKYTFKKVFICNFLLFEAMTRRCEIFRNSHTLAVTLVLRNACFTRSIEL